MASASVGDLVTVDGDRHGIVFDVLSRSKLMIAVADPERGAVMRTVSANALAERAEPGPHDDALQQLIRRTPHPGRGLPRASGGPGNGPRGHTRSPAHRPTGR
jgi:hypothetical protein